MNSPRKVLLLQALWELLRYDLQNRMFGLKSNYGGLRRMRQARVRHDRRDLEREISSVMMVALSLYWKPAKCLQRSIAIARLQRRYGIAAEVVIGYQMAPFSSHAWVEVDGRVTGDSPVYQKRLRILDRIAVPSYR